MASIIEDENKKIPEIIRDPQTNSSYQRLRFFGRGSFGKCYEIQDLATNQIWAGKIVSKKLMQPSQIERVAQEILIHQLLYHKHVVRLHSFFEDRLNVYIVLELCKRRSMMELLERRLSITEPETRFYMHQILLGVQYLHSNNIIHRDLKLENLFLDDDLNVKIGDFGLATEIEFEGQRRQSRCGTPNYIAPEILTAKDYSLEVDIWSVGCIMFTLLVGMGPFEAATLRATGDMIKKCKYSIPLFVREAAAAMIKAQLQLEPSLRPSADKLLQHEFFSSGLMPLELPVSCLTTDPRLDQLEGIVAVQRQSLAALNTNDEMAMALESAVRRQAASAESRSVEPASPRQNLIALRDQLAALLATKLRCRDECLPVELSEPAAQPLVWVVKWLKHQECFGYQLCDESVGVVFNDQTKLIMLANGVNVHYINERGQEQYLTVRDCPQELHKKMKMFTFTRIIMTGQQNQAGASVAVRASDGLSRVPHLHHWAIFTRAVTMYLTNGTLQVNFKDHTKIILCPLMRAVTYVDVHNHFHTFRFATIQEHGCDNKLIDNLTYALDKVKSVLADNLS